MRNGIREKRTKGTNQHHRTKSKVNIFARARRAVSELKAVWVRVDWSFVNAQGTVPPRCHCQVPEENPIATDLQFSHRRVEIGFIDQPRLYKRHTNVGPDSRGGVWG